MVFVCIAALYVVMLTVASHGQPSFADGYDGVGFVLAVSDFDLFRFQPHPPGFPLLVLLSRGLHAGLGLSPALAVALGNSLAMAAGLAAVAGLLCALHGRFVALLFVLLAAPNTLVWGLAVATLSDGAGLGCALLALCASACALSSSSRSLHGLAGVLLGLTLGVRPQSVVILILGLAVLVALAKRRGQLVERALLRMLLLAGLTVLLWFGPLLYSVGPARFFKLCLSHAHGHFTEFGGRAPLSPTALSPALGLPFLRTLFAVLGPAITLLALAAPVALWRCRHRLSAATVSTPAALLIVSVAYLFYALLAMRVVGSGRHLLPLPVALAAALAPLWAAWLRRPFARTALIAAALLLAVADARAVYAFRHSPAPGAQLAAGLPSCDQRVYGARAARFVDLRCKSGTAQPAIYLGEVLADIERRSNPPTEVLVTSEVIASAASQRQLRRLARYCPAENVPRILRFDVAPLHSPSAAASDGPTDCVELLAYRVLP